MNACTTPQGAAAALAPQEQDRADLYALLAALLLEHDATLVEGLAAAPPWPPAEAAALGSAWLALTAAARRCAGRTRDEYEALFVATGNPLLNPYQCYYLAGCLMDKPLVALRSDLAMLGLARSEGSRELEDHLGALCESMRLLVLGGRSEDVQRAFFEKHLAGWSSTCLDDMRSAPGSDFYAAVADFAAAFFALEAQAFGLAQDDAEAPARDHDESMKALHP